MVDMSESISPDLVEHLRKLLSMSLDEIVSKKRSRMGINGHTRYAIPAYIIAVTALEAFTNEMFISPAGRSFYKGPEPESWDVLERNGLSEKLIQLPRMYFGRTLQKGVRPHQDVQLLVSLRNDLVHYKMQFEEPRYITVLRKRGVILDMPNASWMSKALTSNGILWAHNTVCLIIQALGKCADDTHSLLKQMASHGFF